jgi:TolA-binding protein
MPTTTQPKVEQNNPTNRRRWPLALACGVIGLVIGLVMAIATATAPKDTSEYKEAVIQQNAVSAQLDETKAELDSENVALYESQSDLETVQGQVTELKDQITKLQGDIPRREVAVKQAERAVATREQAVAADEKAVAKREKAVGIVETEIQNNTVSDGIYEVGTDIKAGTYKTDGASGCYYAVLGSANTNNIINNSYNDGPAVVSVSTGQYLELACSGADWTLQT